MATHHSTLVCLTVEHSLSIQPFVVATFSLRLLSDVLITGCVCLILLRKRQQAMSECVRVKQRSRPHADKPTGTDP
jgi:hypothetical protein